MAGLLPVSIKPWHFKQAAHSEHHVYYQEVYSSPLINHNFNIYTQTIPISTKIFRSTTLLSLQLAEVFLLT